MDEFTLKKQGYNDLIIRKNNDLWQFVLNINHYGQKTWLNFPKSITDDFVYQQIKEYA